MKRTTAPRCRNLAISLVDILSDHELETVILSLAHGRGARGFNHEQAAAVVEWAGRTRVDSLLLDDVLTGRVAIDLGDEGEMIFSARGSAA